MLTRACQEIRAFLQDRKNKAYKKSLPITAAIRRALSESMTRMPLSHFKQY
jgi:hypothetical protein